MENQEVIIGHFKGQCGDSLTSQQLIALLYMANECSAKQAAQQMAISHRTVEKHINLAKEKLGNKRSIIGLCLEALKRGIIAPLCVAMLFNAAPEARTTAPAQRPSIARTLSTQRNEVSYAAIAA